MTDRNDDTIDFTEADRFADSFFAHPAPPFAPVFGAGTHVGNVRTRNEDQFAVIRKHRTSEMLLTSLPANAWSLGNDDAWCVMVADGVGGAARGDVASSLALQTVLELSARANNWIMKFTDLDAQHVHSRVQAYVQGIQEAFRRHTESHPKTRGMGTTLTTAVIMPPHAIFVQIGDSRAYLLRGDKLSQVTRDHTLAQDLIDAGADPATARSFRHLLTNSLGSDCGNTTFDVFHSELQPEDRILLCSDGLSDYVPAGSIAEIMSGPDPQVACDDMLQQALRAGGRDNITAVLCRLQGQESSTGT